MDRDNPGTSPLDVMDEIKTHNPDLDALFERYRKAPESHIFAPLADACRKAGMLEEAIEICGRGVAANPEYTSGHVVRGKCYFDAGDRATAETCFRRVLSLDEKNLVALKFLGLILAERGDAAEARECFQDILDLDPDDREIRMKLEEIAGSSDDSPDEPHDDIVELEEIDDEGFEGPAIQLGSDNAVSDELATITLADIYASQGYTDKAVRIYREVLELQPDNAVLKEKIRTLTAAGESEPADETARDEAGDLDAEVDEILEMPVSEAPKTSEPAQSETQPPQPPPTSADTDGGPGTDAEKARTDAQSNPRPPHAEDARSYEQFKRWLRDMVN